MEPLSLWYLGPSAKPVEAFWLTNMEANQTPSFWGFYGGGITQALLVNSLATGDCLNL